MEGVFLLGMALGLRIGEATGVVWDDVNLERRMLFLRHQVAPDIQADGGECLCGGGVDKRRLSKSLSPNRPPAV